MGFVHNRHRTISLGRKRDMRFQDGYLLARGLERKVHAHSTGGRRRCGWRSALWNLHIEVHATQRFHAVKLEGLEGIDADTDWLAGLLWREFQYTWLRGLIGWNIQRDTPCRKRSANSAHFEFDMRCFRQKLLRRSRGVDANVQIIGLPCDKRAWHHHR